jgi:hypothetical protein
MKKVTFAQLEGFETWFFSVRDTLHQRYGQAFVNYCLEGSGETNSDLFYEEDENKARWRVWLFYVED